MVWVAMVMSGEAATQSQGTRGLCLWGQACLTQALQREREPQSCIHLPLQLLLTGARFRLSLWSLLNAVLPSGISESSLTQVPGPLKHIPGTPFIQESPASEFMRHPNGPCGSTVRFGLWIVWVVSYLPSQTVFLLKAGDLVFILLFQRPT